MRAVVEVVLVVVAIVVYSSGVPGFPLKEFQEMQRRMASGAEASSSRRSPSPPQNENEEENVIYNCAPKVAFTLDVSKF